MKQRYTALVGAAAVALLGGGGLDEVVAALNAALTGHGVRVVGIELTDKRLARWFQDEAGVSVSVRLPDPPVAVAPVAREGLLRIAAEALWTLEQGSRSSLVSLLLRQADQGQGQGRRVELVLRDDGVPLARRIESPAPGNPYLGLRAIREWARSIGADVRWTALSPRGLEFAVALPPSPAEPA